MQHGVFRATGLDHSVYALLGRKPALLDYGLHAFLCMLPFGIPWSLFFGVLYLAIARRDRLNLVHTVDDRSPGHRRPVFLCKSHPRWVDLKGNDLGGAVRVGDGGCNEPDWPAATAALSVVLRTDHGSEVSHTRWRRFDELLDLHACRFECRSTIGQHQARLI